MLKIVKTTPLETMEFGKVSDINSAGKLRDYFIFYYQSNSTVPIFLKMLYNAIGQIEWAFISTLVGEYSCYKANSPIEAIEKAMKERQVYIVYKENWRDIFLLSPDQR